MLGQGGRGQAAAKGYRVTDNHPWNHAILQCCNKVSSLPNTTWENEPELNSNCTPALSEKGITGFLH